MPCLARTELQHLHRQGIYRKLLMGFPVSMARSCGITLTLADLSDTKSNDIKGLL